MNCVAVYDCDCASDESLIVKYCGITNPIPITGAVLSFFKIYIRVGQIQKIFSKFILMVLTEFAGPKNLSQT